MPSVLTKKGWEVFETEEDAEAFRQKMKEDSKLVEQDVAGNIQEEPQEELQREMTEEDAEKKKVIFGKGISGLFKGSKNNKRNN